MSIYNTSKYPTNEIRDLILFGMKGIKTDDVFVHVKHTSQKTFRGLAHRIVPYSSKAHKLKKQYKYQITIAIGHASWFPVSTGRRVYKRNGQVEIVGYGGKASPVYTVNNWQEAFVAVAAHEARHIYQFRKGKRVSEPDCEKWALRRLEAFRKLKK